jgi:transcription termination factor Rho
MELHLDRRLAERHVFPAMDIQRSSTRREELLLGEETAEQVRLLRRMVSMIASDATNFSETTERVLDRMRRTKTNAEFLATLTKDT